jgi:REP element-mobilizing transposase RayT
MNLRLGEFMVMPDHFHAILGIGDNPFNSGTNKKSFCINRDVDTFYRNPPESRDRTLIPKENLFLHKNLSVNQFAPQSHNLASVLRGFKSAVTMFARKNKVAFDWQPRFHDHIIRSELEYQRISRYIRNNPAKWRSDQLQKQMNILARMEY